MLPVSNYKRKTINLRKGSAKVKILFVSTFLFCGLVSTQLVFANNLAVNGEKISQVKDEILQYENENTTLKAEIAKQSSLAYLSQKADELGFKKPTKLTILK